MNEAELRSLLIVGVFAAAAVGLILYQHSLHTGQVLSAMGAGSGGKMGAVVPAAAPTGYASLAGRPTPGQTNLTPDAPPVAPLQVNAGYTLN